MARLETLRSQILVEKTGSTSGSTANRDIEPLDEERRTYGPWTFVCLWVVTGSVNIGGWTTGSSLIALGLNVWQAMVTVILGNVFVGVFCVLSGMPGAKWHIGFPIVQKASWGVNGFIFVVIQRVFLACIWYATQVYWGAQCVRTLLVAIWPSFARVNKPLAGGTTTSGELASFVIFTILYLPLIWIKPEHYRIPFLTACIFVIPTILVCLIWFPMKAHGLGSFVADVSAIHGVIQATGSHLAWMMILGVCTNISSISVHIYVQSDYTRYARRPRDQILAQLAMVPFGTILVALTGIICTSCAAQILPETDGTLLWEPYRLLTALQMHYDNSPRSRAAAAFGAISFMVAQFGMVVANNGLSGGMDLSALFPRYFTIRRGMLLMSALAFVIQPWQLLNGAGKFLTVMGGYGVFLGPMTGVMFADYFLLRKRKLKLTDLYKSSKDGIYWYNAGTNWRAFVAWAGGVWITMPGFVQRVRNPAVELQGWSYLYYVAWPFGTLLSMGWYMLFNRLSPVDGVGDVDEEDCWDTEGPMGNGEIVRATEFAVGGTEHGRAERGTGTGRNRLAAPREAKERMTVLRLHSCKAV